MPTFNKLTHQVWHDALGVMTHYWENYAIAQ